MSLTPPRVARSKFGAACKTCTVYLPPRTGWVVRDGGGWTAYCDTHVPGGRPRSVS